jgi:high frequency lysogenization protein
MMQTDNDRLLALAGIFQSAELVNQVARNGHAQSSDLETSVYSIFHTDAESVENVFHDKSHLRTGLETLVKQMTEQDSSRIDITRYVLQIMYLAGKLAKNRKALDSLAAGIELAKNRAETFGQTHINVLSQLADLYVENISPLGNKIMVNGEPVHLNNPDNVSRVRTLLLAGVRAAWLWIQCGGKRRHMIFSRRKICNQAQQMLTEINPL